MLFSPTMQIGSGAVLATGVVLLLWPSSSHEPTQMAWNLGITGNGVVVLGSF